MIFLFEDTDTREGFIFIKKNFKLWKWLFLCCSRAFNHISCHLSCVPGLLISNKKEELTAILDHFNVQVLSFLLSCNSLTHIECTISILFLFLRLNVWVFSLVVSASSLPQHNYTWICFSCRSWITRCPSSTKKWVNSSYIQKTSQTSIRCNTARFFMNLLSYNIISTWV